MARAKLTITIITKNEEKNIRRCLESVTWADEIIILDSGSTDNTVAICREFTSDVFVTDWPGFGIQKQRAFEKATSEWVLSIDADEEITLELKAEIMAVLERGTECNGFEIPRQSMFAGKFLKYGGWGKDYVLRLVKKNAGHFTTDIVHERLLVQGLVGRLQALMPHYSSMSINDRLEKNNLYSRLWAEQAFARGRRSGIFKSVCRAYWKFFSIYFLKLSFLEGRFGFLLAVLSAHETFYKYVKLMMLCRSATSKPK
jgi:glycosyltransferase involved in cell wall biosynthesis